MTRSKPTAISPSLPILGPLRYALPDPRDTSHTFTPHLTSAHTCFTLRSPPSAPRPTPLIHHPPPVRFARGSPDQHWHVKEGKEGKKERGSGSGGSGVVELLRSVTLTWDILVTSPVVQHGAAQQKACGLASLYACMRACVRASGQGAGALGTL